MICRKDFLYSSVYGSEYKIHAAGNLLSGEEETSVVESVSQTESAASKKKKRKKTKKKSKETE